VFCSQASRYDGAKESKPFPKCRSRAVHAKHTGGLMLKKQIVDGAGLAARPFLSEHSQLDCVCEFCLAKRSQRKHGLGPDQGSGYS